MNELERPPKADELEISLFGPGVGESAVAHLGNNKWMVVDSCLERPSRTPVAIAYLKRLGVKLEESVVLVVATHWHADHTKGIAQVLELASSARFVCSSALRQEEFKTFAGSSRMPTAQESEVDEFRKALDVLERRIKEEPGVVGPLWASQNQCLYNDAECGTSIHALSPSAASQTRALHEIADLLPSAGHLKKRIARHTPNDLSVALWITSGDRHLLLGGDLEIRALLHL